MYVCLSLCLSACMSVVFVVVVVVVFVVVVVVVVVVVEFISTASSSTVSGLLTLFPKCFSSFLHSTCSLSVSHIYLALEEVYLPMGAAIQNNPTLRRPAR